MRKQCVSCVHKSYCLMPQIFCCHSLWWTRQHHLRMLSPAFTTMPKETWKNCPTFHKCCGTKKNADAKGKHPVSLNIAMITLYKQGKSISTSNVASYPGSRWAGKERAWYTLFAHAFNLPKIWGLRGIF